MSNPLMYVETYCILLSIPIIAILHFSSVIKKEITKRQKDSEYCKSDLMEGETMRNYLYFKEYKSLRGNIQASSIVFLVFVVILLLLSIFEGTPLEMNITSLHASIILVISLILGCILIPTAAKPWFPPSEKTTNTDSENNKLLEKGSENNKLVEKGLDKIYTFAKDRSKKQSIEIYKQKIQSLQESLKKLKSFADFPEAFKKPFIERWVSLQNPNDIMTYSEIIAAIDNEFLSTPGNIINFLRPADNYFFEDKDIVYKKDIAYLISSSENLPPSSEYNKEYRKFNEIIAWIILIFLYYHIYHIYYKDVSMFVYIVIMLIVLLMLCMAVYYISIARYEL